MKAPKGCLHLVIRSQTQKPLPMTTASAPGKIILVGEHAVVYGRPAIAAPVWETVATATVERSPDGSGCLILARDVGLEIPLATTSDQQPLALVTRMALSRLNLPSNPDLWIELRSEIPIASGLGSGAAVSAALVRALYAYTDRPITPELTSAIVYESERFYHGTPSGIDNTVIAYGLPIWFLKGEPPTPLTAGRPFTVAIAHSGVAASTREAVADVRRGWQAAPQRYETWFDEISEIARAARLTIEQGDLRNLGALLDRNQSILEKLGVSSPVLARLIAAARDAGALGAKLSGGGRGGNIIALIDAESRDAVREALYQAGAQRVIITIVSLPI